MKHLLKFNEEAKGVPNMPQNFGPYKKNVGSKPLPNPDIQSNFDDEGDRQIRLERRKGGTYAFVEIIDDVASGEDITLTPEQREKVEAALNDKGNKKVNLNPGFVPVKIS